MVRTAIMMMKKHGRSSRKWNLTEVSSHDEASSALKKKNCLLTLQHGPLSARRELQSHPLAGQAQACGRLTKGGSAGGPMAPIVTTGVLIVERKKNLLTRHLCARCHVNLSVSFHRRSTICACHPSAKMQFFTVSWSRNFRNA